MELYKNCPPLKPTQLSWLVSSLDTESHFSVDLFTAGKSEQVIKVAACLGTTMHSFG